MCCKLGILHFSKSNKHSENGSCTTVHSLVFLPDHHWKEKTAEAHKCHEQRPGPSKFQKLCLLYLLLMLNLRKYWPPSPHIIGTAHTVAPTLHRISHSHFPYLFVVPYACLSPSTVVPAPLFQNDTSDFHLLGLFLCCWCSCCWVLEWANLLCTSRKFFSLFEVCMLQGRFALPTLGDDIPEDTGAYSRWKPCLWFCILWSINVVGSN